MRDTSRIRSRFFPEAQQQPNGASEAQPTGAPPEAAQEPPQEAPAPKGVTVPEGAPNLRYTVSPLPVPASASSAIMPPDYRYSKPEPAPDQRYADNVAANKTPRKSLGYNLVQPIDQPSMPPYPTTYPLGQRQPSSASTSRLTYPPNRRTRGSARGF